MTHRTATPLTSFEAAVLAKLLDGAHPALGALRAQMRGAMARSRKFSGAGFFIDLAIPEDLPRAPVHKPSRETKRPQARLLDFTSIPAGGYTRRGG
jgi:hypothetical protein